MVSVNYESYNETINEKDAVYKLPNKLENDIWNIDDSFFKNWRSQYKSWSRQNKINFGIIQNKDVKNHIKGYAYQALVGKKLSLRTLVDYFRSSRLDIFNSFISIKAFKSKTYKEILSEENIEKHYELYLSSKEQNLKDPYKLIFFRQIPSFLFSINDYRGHDDNSDIWDVRNIDESKISKHRSDFKLNFSNISNKDHKWLAKKFIKVRLSTLKQTTCASDLRIIAHFLNFLYRNSIDIDKLTRSDIESYIFVLQKEKFDKRVFLLSIKTFVKYLQLSQNEHAPETNIEALIFNQDYPRRTNKKDKTVKYIEDEILEQLENNLDKLTPAKYIPVIILLRASGWRISDVLNLRYDNCLSKTKNGYFLSGDIQKTQVLEHKIPISDEIVAIVKDCIESTKSNKYNKDKYLFCSKDGKRKGLPYSSENIQDSLNRFAKNYNITDIDGNIFRFKTHAFRHTKAVELINNGMNLLHVQKWLAHLTPVMTLHYAKILDNTMRKSWEEATKDGMFKLDGTGKALKVELSDISDEDIIEWEWIKHNLDAVRMPLGYCMKPNKMECATQLNPCLTCRSLCTTPEFIPTFEQEIYQTKEIINKGKSQNRTFWVEKNELLLNKLESVLSVLKSGKIKHDAGKQGREYVGEQRK